MKRALLLCVLVACGGKIDDGLDAGADAGGNDSSSPEASADAPTPPPPCVANGLPCASAGECCALQCSQGVCGGPPPPPPCKPDGVACSNAAECCSDSCAGTCGIQVACASASNKLCDQCIAQSCCNDQIACEGDPPCDMWQACVTNCEQQGKSAFACTSPGSLCDQPTDAAEKALYTCAQSFCGQECTKD